MIQRMKAWWAGVGGKRRARREASFRALFNRELGDKNSSVHKLVLENAVPMAGGMVRRWLDDRRIRHCGLCVSTDQLRKVERPDKKFLWSCPDHVLAAQKVVQAYKANQLSSPGDEVPTLEVV